MIRCAIADVHLSEFKNDNILGDGLPERLSEINRALRTVCDFCVQNNIVHLDIIGDLNNDKNIVFTDAQNIIKTIIQDYRNIEFWLITGNHDLSSTGTHQTSCVSVFEDYDNVRCFTEMEIVDNITIVPFSNHIVEDVHRAPSNSILLSHFGLSEAVLQSGLSIVAKLGLRDLSKFKLVILGHYHKPQLLEGNNTILYYVGNPVHLNWNDKNEDKRFLVYDTESLEVTSVPLTNFIQYREFVIEDAETAKEIMIQAEDARKEGHHVRVRKTFKGNIEGTSSELTVIEDVEAELPDRGVTSSMSHDEKMVRYMEIKEIPEAKRSSFLEVGKMFLDGMFKKHLGEK